MNTNNNLEIIKTNVEVARRDIAQWNAAFAEDAKRHLNEFFGGKLALTFIPGTLLIYNINQTKYYLIYKNSSESFKAFIVAPIYCESEVNIRGLYSLGVAIMEIEEVLKLTQL